MSTSRIPLLFRAILLLVCFASWGARAQGQDEHEFYKMLRTIEDILAGKNSGESRKAVGAGATFIREGKLEDLRSVLSGEHGECLLADTSYRGIAVQGRTNTSEDMGYIVLKTRTADTTRVRFHTVVFAKDSTGRYLINTWHADGCNR